MPRNSLPAAESGALSTNGIPAVTCGHQRRIQRHLPEQRHIRADRPRQALGDLTAAALAEHSHRGAVGQHQPRHVLDDADDALTGLQRDRTRALGDLGRGQLRCCHNEDLGAWDQLRHRDRDVAGARRQVEQQHVQIAPVHVGEELLKRAVQHRPAPHHRRIALGELGDRDHPNVVGDRRKDHRLDLGGPFVGAHHPRDRMPVDVGVEHADREAAGRHRRGEVDRHARLADAALAGGDRIHPRQRSRLGERDHGFARVAAQLLAQFGALLVVHHVEADLDRAGARHIGDRGRHLLGDLGLLRARLGGQVDPDVHAAVGVDVDALDHAELGDRPA